MAELVPVAPGASLAGGGGGPILTRLKNVAAQPAVKRAIPWFLGVAALGGAGLTWAMLGPVPQRVLYSQLDDSERASVVAALDKGSVHYHIDNSTGVLTVNEDDLYKARMLVAQNGALAMPDSASDSLDKLPMGASRAVEDQRLQANREHELELSIKQIDGVQTARVHLAEGQQSVFVRDAIAPTASVMLRLADGRQLSQSQVSAIVNLVAGSVPGLTPDAVHVVDQHGHLLTQKTDPDSNRLELQTRMEDKLGGQISQLLMPMLGESNFSSEVQVDLDMDQVTSARETYDKQGVLRSETQAQSAASGAVPALGVPGVLSNTPPPATSASPTPPKGSPSPAPSPSASPSPGASASPAPGPGGEASATRQYELGREVAVSNQRPGKIKHLSVAVALSAAAMAKYKQTDIDQIKSLVSAAVGADTTRGDTVTVVVRSFETAPPLKVPFYEAPWFATVLHNSVALIAVLLVLLLGVRPLIKALKRQAETPPPATEEEAAEGEEQLASIEDMTDPVTGAIDADALGRQVGLAQRIVTEKPDESVIALRNMLKPAESPA